MSRGVNKVILIGNLGQDPEVRYTAEGTAVASFTVATSEIWKDKNSGDQKEHTEWHRISAWGKLGEICGEYLHKGSKVFIEGQIKTRKWEDQQGNDRYTTEINARTMQMLDSRAEGTANHPQARQQPQQRTNGTNTYAQAKGRQQPPPAQQQAANAPGTEPFDDDIPFAARHFLS